jgi:hypothetical protein
MSFLRFPGEGLSTGDGARRCGRAGSRSSRQLQRAVGCVFSLGVVFTFSRAHACHAAVEKHRPREIKDIVGNHEGVQRLEIIGREGNLPNIIISGPPGTGKTTSILCLASALLGPAAKEAVLELNASDERGIDVVRVFLFVSFSFVLSASCHSLSLVSSDLLFF